MWLPGSASVLVPIFLALVIYPGKSGPMLMTPPPHLRTSKLKVLHSGALHLGSQSRVPMVPVTKWLAFPFPLINPPCKGRHPHAFWTSGFPFGPRGPSDPPGPRGPRRRCHRGGGIGRRSPQHSPRGSAPFEGRWWEMFFHTPRPVLVVASSCFFLEAVGFGRLATPRPVLHRCKTKI